MRTTIILTNLLAFFFVLASSAYGICDVRITPTADNGSKVEFDYLIHTDVVLPNEPIIWSYGYRSSPETVAVAKAAYGKLKGELARATNRATIKWLSAHKKEVEEWIKSRLSSFTLKEIKVAYGETETKRVAAYTPDYSPGYKGIYGAYGHQVVTFTAVLEEEFSSDKAVKFTEPVFNYSDDTNPLKEWRGGDVNDLLRIGRQAVERFDMLLAAQEDACAKWEQDLHDEYGQQLIFAFCKREFVDADLGRSFESVSGRYVIPSIKLDTEGVFYLYPF